MKKSAAVTPRVTLQRSLLSMAVAAATFGMAPAHAVQFEFMDGEVTGSFDTTLTYGALWRVTGQDPRLIPVAKGGTRDSANFDNGNVNYRRGEKVSSLFKMTNELELKYKNFGAFSRVLSFYDHEIQNKNFDPNFGDPRVIKNRLGHDYEILDAFVFGNFNVLDRNLRVTAGKQVVSLGESTFIPNGLNVLNPIDVQRLRSPGAELKDALLPTQMLTFAYDLNDNLSVELINKFQFRETRLEPNGSFFSTNDFLSPGGEVVLIGNGFGNEAAGPRIRRADDVKAKHTGQYAVVLRYLAPELNNTEFGLYHINAHATAPSFGGTFSGRRGQEPSDPTNPLESTYFAIYPENIATTGISFNTLGPYGIALQGEYIYRKNQPISLVANNALMAFLSGNMGGAANLNNGFIGSIAPGESRNGFRQVSMHQAQITATALASGDVPKFIGANQIVTVFEAGYTRLNLPKGVDFGGPGVDFTTAGSSTIVGGQPISSNKGLLTENSYGYRVAIRAPYNDAFKSINLIPRFVLQHDIRGTSPTFVEGTKSANIGITAEYQNKISADISYTNFFGGRDIGVGSIPMSTDRAQVRSTNQQLADRDFIAATISYAF